MSRGLRFDFEEGRSIWREAQYREERKKENWSNEEKDEGKLCLRKRNSEGKEKILYLIMQKVYVKIKVSSQN